MSLQYKSFYFCLMHGSRFLIPPSSTLTCQTRRRKRAHLPALLGFWDELCTKIQQFCHACAVFDDWITNKAQSFCVKDLKGLARIEADFVKPIANISKNPTADFHFKFASALARLISQIIAISNLDSYRNEAAISDFLESVKVFPDIISIFLCQRSLRT